MENNAGLFMARGPGQEVSVLSRVESDGIKGRDGSSQEVLKY